MVRARTAIPWVISGLCAGLLAVPAAANADGNGGTAAPSTGTPVTQQAPTSTGGALAVDPSAVLQHQVAVVSGSVPVAGAAHGVSLQVRQDSGSWVTVVSGAAAADGSFAIGWRTNRTGQLTLRVISSDVASTSSVTATPQVTLSVYKQIVATWYGPGFYGHRTACGERLTRHIVGVADRTLPCGTPVSVSFNGHTLTLPVIDRGPYTNGVTIDLTHAAAQELGVTETVSVGMLSLTGPPLAPADWFAPTSPTVPSGASGASGPTSIAGGAAAPAAPTGSTGTVGATTAGGASVPGR
jgi:rare lipoprotein A